jgi:hypothetical protein
MPLITAIPGVSCVKPKAALYMFPRLDPQVYPIDNDQDFIAELLQEERVLLVQGSGFNWPAPDHFRLVFLPYEDDLRDAIARIARFLALIAGAPEPRRSCGEFATRLLCGCFSLPTLPDCSMKPINVGLLGIGTVGGGTYAVLKRNAEEITRRAGRPIQVSIVADRDLERTRQLTGGSCRVTDDAFAVVSDPEVDIVVELIGGYGVARELVLQAIANGKHVVTANKALLPSMATRFLPPRRKKA